MLAKNRLVAEIIGENSRKKRMPGTEVIDYLLTILFFAPRSRVLVSPCPAYRRIAVSRYPRFPLGVFRCDLTLTDL